MVQQARRPMMAAVAMVVACAAGGVMRAAAADDEARKSGIYLENASGEATRLSGNMPKMDAQVGAAAAFGFGKPKMTTTIAGERASLRVPAGGTFLFVFSGRSDMRAMMNDPMAAMGMMDELPQHTSSPKDYALIRFAGVDGDRAWDNKKGQQVKCAVEKVSAKVFRIRPEQPLPPGEYAFAVMTQGAAGMIWDFGVDATAP
jgi:hypothetical protein